MREILFRGKRVDNNEWAISGDVFLGGKRKYIYIPNPDTDMSAKAYLCREIIPETVGQYTGLTDKNGTKIFEGDECRLTRHCILCYGSITFKKGSFWFEEFNTDSVIELNRLKPNNFEIEVIGNIHDNPELLKGGADNGKVY